MRFLAALFLLLSSASFAAEGTPPPYKHVIDDHVFPPLFYVDRAFSDTTAQISLGVAKRSLPFGGQDLSLGGFSPSVEVQVNVWKGLSVSLGLTGSLVAGINGNSALAYGASTSYTISVGANYEVWRDEHNLFSGALEVNHPHTLAVSPLNASLAGLVGLETSANQSFITSGVNTQFRPTIRYARSFGAIFGAQAEIGASVNDTAAVGESGPRFLFAAGGDVDFGKFTPVEISLSVTYARNQILALPGSNSDVLDFGILDATSKTFNAGGDVILVWTGGSTTTAGVVRIRTYFN